MRPEIPCLFLAYFSGGVCPSRLAAKCKGFPGVCALGLLASPARLTRDLSPSYSECGLIRALAASLLLKIATPKFLIYRRLSTFSLICLLAMSPLSVFFHLRGLPRLWNL